MSSYNEQINVARKVMEEDKEILVKISQSKSITELCAEYPNLNEYIHKLEQRLKDYEQFSIRTSPPTKTYKELENKLANFEADKQQEIDYLWQETIIPLQNQLKNSNAKLDASYNVQQSQKERIKGLEKVIHNQDTILNYAIGYISATHLFKDKHPNEVKNWLFGGLNP